MINMKTHASANIHAHVCEYVKIIVKSTEVLKIELKLLSRILLYVLLTSKN